MIQDNSQRFRDALAADLGRPSFESQLYARSTDQLTPAYTFVVSA